MITSTEVARGIRGAWLLARFDPTGMDLFDKTIEGFWRSFWVAALVAPAYLLLVAIMYQAREFTAGPLYFYTAQAIFYVIGWVAFPFAMFYLTQLMDRSSEYIDYIVAYNWSHILQTALFVPVAVLSTPGADQPSGWSLLMMIAFLAILVYVWFIAKTALKIPGMMATGVVTLDIALTIFIDGINDALVLG